MFDCCCLFCNLKPCALTALRSKSICIGICVAEHERDCVSLRRACELSELPRCLLQKANVQLLAKNIPLSQGKREIICWLNGTPVETTIRADTLLRSHSRGLVCIQSDLAIEAQLKNCPRSVTGCCAHKTFKREAYKVDLSVKVVSRIQDAGGKWTIHSSACMLGHLNVDKYIPTYWDLALLDSKQLDVALLS